MSEGLPATSSKVPKPDRNHPKHENAGLLDNPANSEWTLIQPVDNHDQDLLSQEILQIRDLRPESSFAVIPVRVDWFQDLSPWPAPAVLKGQSDFGSGAAETLEQIIREIVPEISGKKVLGGYSLAGLFALWASYQTDLFDGIVAASPSVWYPGWDEYIAQHKCLASKVYLSLGKQEEKAGNPVMRTVGDRIRMQHRLLREQNIQTVLEWNPGNHFREPDRRTAAGFAWIMAAER